MTLWSRWLGNLVLAVCSVLIGLLTLECVSRMVKPLGAPVWIDPNGRPVDLGPGNRFFPRLPPATKVRMIAPEYDTIATIDAVGNRVPDSDKPDVLLLGDSYTFGLGVSDNQTFAWIYCHGAKKKCANLGRPGTGTVRQLQVLQYYLAAGWRPRDVKLFAFVMTSFLGSGNDLADNLVEAAARGEVAGSLAPAGFWERVLGYHHFILSHSNLARVIYFIDGPMLKSWFSPLGSSPRLAKALSITSEQLASLAQLSSQYRFRCEIYLIEPIQDVSNGTYPKTARAILAIAHGLPVIDLGPVLQRDARHYYYPFDAHLNQLGHAVIGSFLLQQQARATLQGAPRA